MLWVLHTTAGQVQGVFCYVGTSKYYFCPFERLTQC